MSAWLVFCTDSSMEDEVVGVYTNEAAAEQHREALVELVACSLSQQASPLPVSGIARTAAEGAVWVEEHHMSDRYEGLA